MGENNQLEAHNAAVAVVVRLLTKIWRMRGNVGEARNSLARTERAANQQTPLTSLPYLMPFPLIHSRSAQNPLTCTSSSRLDVALASSRPILYVHFFAVHRFTTDITLNLTRSEPSLSPRNCVGEQQSCSGFFLVYSFAHLFSLSNVSEIWGTRFSSNLLSLCSVLTPVSVKSSHRQTV